MTLLDLVSLIPTRQRMPDHPINGPFLIWMGIVLLISIMLAQLHGWNRVKKDPSLKNLNQWDRYRTLRLITGYVISILSIVCGILLNG